MVGEESPRAFVDDVWDRVRAGPPDAVEGLIDRDLFADRATAAMLPAARAGRDSFRPDLVVREPCEYVSAVAAHEAGIPQAQVGISLAAIEREVLDMVTPTIERHGPGVAEAVGAAPYLSSFPASLDPFPWPDTRRFRPPAPPPGALPDWWPGDDRPLVYVSFGSVVGHLAEAAGVYRTAIDAVAELSARVLVTVGRATEVSRVGPVPANTHVEQWVSQADVVAHAALVVCHGGSGTTFSALAAGVPLVLCPLFADQPRNGRVVEAAGAGLVGVSGGDDEAGGLRRLGPADVAPLRRAIERVLGEPSYRRGAESVSIEMLAAPTLDEVVEGLFSHR